MRIYQKDHEGTLLFLSASLSYIFLTFPSLALFGNISEIFSNSAVFMKTLLFCIRTNNGASFPTIISDNEEWIVSVYSVSYDYDNSKTFFSCRRIFSYSLCLYFFRPISIITLSQSLLLTMLRDNPNTLLLLQRFVFIFAVFLVIS